MNISIFIFTDCEEIIYPCILVESLGTTTALVASTTSITRKCISGGSHMSFVSTLMFPDAKVLFLTVVASVAAVILIPGTVMLYYVLYFAVTEFDSYGLRALYLLQVPPTYSNECQKLCFNFTCDRGVRSLSVLTIVSLGVE